MEVRARYIWIDETFATQGLRSQSVVVLMELTQRRLDVEDFPCWTTRGPATFVLRPERVVPDPFRSGDYLVLCEVVRGDNKCLS